MHDLNSDGCKFSASGDPFIFLLELIVFAGTNNIMNDDSQLVDHVWMIKYG